MPVLIRFKTLMISLPRLLLQKSNSLFKKMKTPRTFKMMFLWWLMLTMSKKTQETLCLQSRSARFNFQAPICMSNISSVALSIASGTNSALFVAANEMRTISKLKICTFVHVGLANLPALWRKQRCKSLAAAAERAQVEKKKRAPRLQHLAQHT